MQHSVWLSAVPAGVYDLRSAQYGTHYDDWTQSRAGLRLTISPEVQQWGGTHNLFVHITDQYSSYQNWVASDDQRPGRFTFPNKLPSIPNPPDPTDPIPIVPPIGTAPPPPPIDPPIVPPTVVPPIGVVPPPPPIDPPVVPPTGIVPPPPPIDPPVIVPPTVVPPTVVPPTGIVPPTTVVPKEPPPTTFPGIGVGVASVSPGGQAASQAMDAGLPCVLPLPENTTNENTLPLEGWMLDGRCVARPGQQIRVLSPSPVKTWNVWANLSYLDVTDHRNGTNMTGHSTALIIGADKRLDNGLILGMTAGWQKTHSSSFDNMMGTDSKTHSLGVYGAKAVSANWMVDGSLSYAQSDNTQSLLVLSGDVDSNAWSTTLGATGQYLWSQTIVRPRVALNYSRATSDAYALTGNYNGISLRLPADKDRAEFGSLTLSTEFSRVFFTPGGMPVVPYLDLSLDYAFMRPNDGRMLAGDLTTVRTSAVSGAVRVGVRLKVTRDSDLTFATGYTSLGQNGLNVSEYRIYYAHAF